MGLRLAGISRQRFLRLFRQFRGGIGLLLIACPLHVVSSAEPGAKPASEQQRTLQRSGQVESKSIARRSSSTVSRAEIRSLINQAAKHHGVEPALVHAVVSAESAYDPAAVSKAGAIGLMQVMPATAADYGVADPLDLHEPSVNVNIGVRHLKRLLQKYRNDYGRVIMAYNAGEGVVDRTDSNVVYPETLNYTEAVVRRYQRFGGVKPTAGILRKVAVLRGRGRTSEHQTLKSEDRSEISLLLPKASPRLNANLLSRSDEPATRPGPRNSSNMRARTLERAVRPAHDPAIRNYVSAPEQP
jgi:hypothetical protein